MSNFADWFSKIIVINLARRPDRWEHFQSEMDKIGVGVGEYERFEAHDKPTGNAKEAGNFGCCSSHRGVLELICHHRWSHTMIFEDDAEVIDPKNFAALWTHCSSKIPDDWDMVYLGGHWGSAPLARVNPNVLRVDTMLTTSSYAITLKTARELCPHVYGVGPIDSIFSDTGSQKDVPHSGFLARHKTYCLQPRLFCQYTNYSDLQYREMNNSMSMKDRSTNPSCPTATLAITRTTFPRRRPSPPAASLIPRSTSTNRSRRIPLTRSQRFPTYDNDHSMDRRAVANRTV